MKKLLAIFFLAGLMAAGYTWWMFNKPQENIAGKNADVEWSTGQLLAAFQDDAAAADESLAGKIVRVSGIPTGVQKTADQTVISFDAKGNYILQAYHTNTPGQELTAAGDAALTLKCKYAGYVINDEDFMIPADIKLEKCIVEN